MFKRLTPSGEWQSRGPTASTPFSRRLGLNPSLSFYSEAISIREVGVFILSLKKGDDERDF